MKHVTKVHADKLKTLIESELYVSENIWLHMTSWSSKTSRRSTRHFLRCAIQAQHLNLLFGLSWTSTLKTLEARTMLIEYHCTRLENGKTWNVLVLTPSRNCDLGSCLLQVVRIQNLKNHRAKRKTEGGNKISIGLNQRPKWIHLTSESNDGDRPPKSDGGKGNLVMRAVTQVTPIWRLL